MKLLHLTKIATLASLLALSNIGCAADPVKPSTTAPSTTIPAPNQSDSKDSPVVGTKLPPQPASFKMGQDGEFVPLTKEGREFKSCGTLEKNTCAPFNKKVTLGNVNFTLIGQIDFSVNPQCQIWVIVVNGKAKVYYDPTDPNCPKFN
ncbi:MAG: hypothetical protein U1F46_04100 [Marinagarivorans sp.]